MMWVRSATLSIILTLAMVEILHCWTVKCNVKAISINTGEYSIKSHPQLAFTVQIVTNMRNLLFITGMHSL